MLPILPLLIADPSLPMEVRLALLGTPEEITQALLGLGLSCREIRDLAGLELHGPCEG